jgi:hypothetical protein
VCSISSENDRGEENGIKGNPRKDSTVERRYFWAPSKSSIAVAKWNEWLLRNVPVSFIFLKAKDWITSSFEVN